MVDLSLDPDRHVGVITLSRPDARNAIDPSTTVAIEAAIDTIEADRAIWVGVLTAAPPVFCAGADLKAVQAGRGGELHTARGGFAGVVRRDRSMNVAMEILMTGDAIDATRAFDLGLVNIVTESGAALDGALALAARVCANAPEAVRLSRAVALEATNADDSVGWTRSGDAFDAVSETDDFREGVVAFLEKRAPAWAGR